MEDSDRDKLLLSATFGATIRRIRKERGWSQGELGEKLHVSLSTVSKLENGRTTVNLDHLQALASAFSLTPEALLGEHADPREAKLLHAIRSGNLEEALAALANAMDTDVIRLQQGERADSSPTVEQFEALGRNAAQLARSAASIVAATRRTNVESLVSAWFDESPD